VSNNGLAGWRLPAVFAPWPLAGGVVPWPLAEGLVPWPLAAGLGPGSMAMQAFRTATERTDIARPSLFIMMTVCLVSTPGCGVNE
jgi:hypothetical protein